MRRERVNLAVSLASLAVMNIKAQTAIVQGNHTITAGIGIQVVKDERLSSSSKRFNSIALAWSFSNSNGYRKKSLLASIETNTGNSGKDLLQSNEVIIQYSNAFSIVRNKASRWNNFTGYAVNINPQYIKSKDQYSWATGNSLSFYNSSEYSWGRSIVSVDLVIPVAGFGSRPCLTETYKGSVNDMLYNSFSHLAFTSLHNLKAINVSLQYQQAITARLHFKASAAFSYKDLTISQRFRQQACKVNAGLSFRVM